MYNTDNTPTVKITARLVKETSVAYLLNCEGDEDWFPKSQITFNVSKSEAVIPTWLLDKKGWIY